jgi:hypothetical protein
MTPPRILAALVDAAKNMIMIACACAGAGLVISVILTTGFGLQLSNMVIGFSGGYYLPALFFIMVSAIILGMGLPTTAAYVLAISVGARPDRDGRQRSRSTPSLLRRHGLRDASRGAGGVCGAACPHRPLRTGLEARASPRPAISSPTCWSSTRASPQGPAMCCWCWWPCRGLPLVLSLRVMLTTHHARAGRAVPGGDHPALPVGLMISSRWWPACSSSTPYLLQKRRVKREGAWELAAA